MSVSIYQSHLEAAPKQYTLLKMLRPPVYEIELSNNQLIGVCYYKDGSSKRYQVNATFSNRRMVIADFLSAVEAMAALLLKFPKHPFGTNGFAVANVTQELVDQSHYRSYLGRIKASKKNSDKYRSKLSRTSD